MWLGSRTISRVLQTTEKIQWEAWLALARSAKREKQRKIHLKRNLFCSLGSGSQWKSHFLRRPSFLSVDFSNTSNYPQKEFDCFINASYSIESINPSSWSCGWRQSLSQTLSGWAYRDRVSNNGWVTEFLETNMAALVIGLGDYRHIKQWNKNCFMKSSLLTLPYAADGVRKSLIPSQSAPDPLYSHLYGIQSQS